MVGRLAGRSAVWVLALITAGALWAQQRGMQPPRDNVDPQEAVDPQERVASLAEPVHSFAFGQHDGEVQRQYFAQRDRYGQRDDDFQRDRWGGRGRFRDDDLDDWGRRGVPDWEVDPRYPNDVFTFVRVRYDSGGYGRRGGGWRTDFPDSDLNFSLRLQQLTSLRVNPNPIVLELTDDRLFDYPFLYMIEPGRMTLYHDEVEALRRYLLNGGFLMVDDFWGEYEYRNCYNEMKRVFPDREPQELPLSHEIFHCVYDLKERPQVPAIGNARQGRDGMITWEWRPESDTSIVHYQGIFDDEGRMMVIICHNTDLGDGWEREGENEWYFEEFSVKKAYPMGINIVTYAMTH